MKVTDPIADYLTRIRNAIRARHQYVDMPASNLKQEISEILKNKNYIKNYILISDNKQGIIRVFLKYDEKNRSIITGIKRVSKPSLRQYVNVNSIPRVRNNLGIAIISTSKGVMTNLEAKKKRIGGEVLCYVW